MIGVRGLRMVRGGRAVLDGVDFAASHGELVVLVGPNGAGKSTLLRALAGLEPGGRPEPKRVAYLPQDARCAWGMTVEQVAALGRIPHGDNDQAAVAAALTDCGIEHLRGARIDRVSGGEARRAMLARAFATQAACFLLDEPTADLDPAAAHEIMTLLRARVALGNCVVMVLHAIDLAACYATRMVVLQAGQVVADGVPDAVLPQVAAVFGMEYGIDSRPRLLPPRDSTGGMAWC